MFPFFLSPQNSHGPGQKRIRHQDAVYEDRLYEYRKQGCRVAADSYASVDVWINRKKSKLLKQSHERICPREMREREVNVRQEGKYMHDELIII